MPTFTPTVGQRIYFQERVFILYQAVSDDQWLGYEALSYPMGAGMVLLNVSDMSDTPPPENSLLVEQHEE